MFVICEHLGNGLDHIFSSQVHSGCLDACKSDK